MYFFLYKFILIDLTSWVFSHRDRLNRWFTAYFAASEMTLVFGRQIPELGEGQLLTYNNHGFGLFNNNNFKENPVYNFIYDAFGKHVV